MFMTITPESVGQRIAYQFRMQRKLIRFASVCCAAAIAFLPRMGWAVTPWSLSINTNNVVNATGYGAVGDGVTTNTTAIQNAINAAAAGGLTNSLRGGVV